ncbi:MAG: hypothetical protein OXN17_10555 [Candidatus Poribacteria bacterium]|nr:hypothetical protein [Candidatus Poribacteria bacterium]MDE0505344.1 hypothetical protein [Candidatus Poribacteria bacterium]
MPTNTLTTKVVVGVILLAIITAGVLVVRRITASSDETPRVVYQLPKSKHSEQRKQLLERITRAQVRRAPQAAAVKSNDRGEVESDHAGSAHEPDETDEGFDAADFEEWGEDEQVEEAPAYDKIYDHLIDAAEKIQSVMKQIERIDKEVDRVFGDWKRSVRDPKNPTKEEERAIVEAKEEMAPMFEAREELNDSLGSFVEDVASAVPSALRTESYGPEKQRLSFDYSQIRSALGAPPERYDGHLSEFFASFEYWNVSK